MSIKHFKKFVLVYLILVSLMFAQGVLGAEELPGVDITIQDVAGIITGIACWLIRVVLAVMIIFLIISGAKFFLAQGNQEAVTKAKENIKWVLIGIVVVLATNIIIATIANWLGAEYSFLPLNCM